MFRKRQNRPLVSSVYFRFFRVTTILFRHNSRRPKTRRPRASWFIVASRTSRSRRARISVFQRCARTRRLSSPHVHRSSVERLARDLKHEKRPRLFVSCEGRVLRSVQDARSRSLVTTTDASSTTKLSQYARRRTAMSSMSGDGGGDQVAPASKPGIGRRRDEGGNVSLVAKRSELLLLGHLKYGGKASHSCYRYGDRLCLHVHVRDPWVAPRKTI